MQDSLWGQPIPAPAPSTLPRFDSRGGQHSDHMEVPVATPLTAPGVAALDVLDPTSLLTAQRGPFNTFQPQGVAGGLAGVARQGQVRGLAIYGKSSSGSSIPRSTFGQGETVNIHISGASPFEVMTLKIFDSTGALALQDTARADLFGNADYPYALPPGITGAFQVEVDSFALAQLLPLPGIGPDISTAAFTVDAASVAPNPNGGGGGSFQLPSPTPTNTNGPGFDWNTLVKAAPWLIGGVAVLILAPSIAGAIPRRTS